jgi:ABC-type branched-subunit amino acid transport system substrate-binding protein
MAYESTAEPIKLGYLFDFVLPDGYPQEMRDDLTNAFELVFEDGLAQGVIDRPVQIIFREVEGLPKGSVKAVIDAYGELVDEGCLAVFGPAITDNCVPTREAIEERFKVPAISVTGTEDWLGEWTFSLSMGSMTDEPIFWAHLIAKRGLTDVGVLVEQSLVGEHYITSFRRACKDRGIRIIAEEEIPQTAQDITGAVHKLQEAKAQAVVHCGFGFGIVLVNPSFAELDWDPPRFMGTSFRRACKDRGIRIIAEEEIPQTAQDITGAVRKLQEAKAQAVVHCGFGFGIVLVNPSFAELDWDPPRFMGTSFQNAWINKIVWDAIVGWTGLDQYDPGNQVGQAFLDRYNERYGRRPEYCVPVVNRDLATVLLHAFADARPLSPRGVRDALERIRLLPAASGSPGTRISLGKYAHRGWMGTGYLVARRLDADGHTAHLVERFTDA